MRRRKRVLPVIGILLALALGMSGCAFGGNAVSQLQANLAKQKEVALGFRKTYPAVEKIRFTQAGSEPGFGAPWSVNAVVTYGGQDYEEILSIHAISGDPLPDMGIQSASVPLLLIFSDGSSEVIE